MIMTAIAVVLVVVLALVSYDLGRSEGVATSYVTTTVYRNVELTGTCTAVSYIIPNTEEVSVTNVTITSGTITAYTLSTVAVSHAGETTLGTTTYSTSTYANYSAAYTVTSTSENLNDLPSNG